MNTKRLPTMDAIRILLASLVLYSHCYPLLLGSDNFEPLYILTEGQLTFGGLAVDAFFILSGYLIAQSWVRDPGFSFFKKRAIRIYPGFVVAVLVGVVLVAPLSTNLPTHTNVWSLVVHLLNLQGYDPHNAFSGNHFRTLNGSLWSIRYEFLCYIGVALLGLTGLLKRRSVLTSIWGGSWVLSVACGALGKTPTLGPLEPLIGYLPFWVRLLPYYLSGVMLWAWESELPDFSGFEILFLVWCLLIGCLTPGFGVAFMFPVALPVILHWLSRQSVIGAKWITESGDISYGVYLYGFLVQQLVVRWVPGLTVWTFLVLSLPITILLGAASWKYVERPILGWRRSGRGQ